MPKSPTPKRRAPVKYAEGIRGFLSVCGTRKWKQRDALVSYLDMQIIRNGECDRFSLWQRRFLSEPVCAILARYAEAGGDPDRVTLLLWQLACHCEEWDTPRKPPKTVIARYRRAVAALDAILELPAFQCPPYYRQHIIEGRDAVGEALGCLEAPSPRVTHHDPGRRPGVTLPTLIVALLAEEFRQRFEKAHWADVLTLVMAAAPSNAYPEGMTTERLRVAAKQVSKAMLTALHAANMDKFGFFFSPSDR